ncbi:dihydropteroate synthase [Fulvivirga sp. RKSG066]|nr:dihydropteroate synthase [Fulvivirga aurantia]MTI22267.1 dihydropteroate synthase [Fulvivirga aurantia]
MGILNVTPDSFFSGSRKNNLDEALATAEKMMNEGATFLDVGGYSSRPGAQDISIEEEIGRTSKIIEHIKTKIPEAIVSIDTFRSEVARKAINVGADIINDISGGELDKNMFDLVAEVKVPYIMMHMRGTPQNMVTKTDYEDILKEVVDYFQNKLNVLHKKGVSDIILDPGFGFAKNRDQNYRLLRELAFLDVLEQPVLVGVSRKSMIYKSLESTPEDALNGTTALNTIALLNGANILRVHDVKEAVEVVKLMELTYN